MDKTFERAIGSLHRYRADGPARHWILTIARRDCVDSTRRRRRGRRLQQRLADQPTAQHAARSMPSEAAELDDLLAQLDADRRAAFVATQVLGLRYDGEEGRALAARIAESLRDAAYAASIELAREKGPFPPVRRGAPPRGPLRRAPARNAG